MTEWLNMGGYGFFVWTSYGIFAGVMLFLLITSIMRGRQARKLARKHLSKERTKEVNS